MNYALLFYVEESATPAHLPEDQRAAFAAEMDAIVAELRRAGAFVGSQRLLTVDTATTVRERAGRTLVTDGPFADTKECLAGFFLIDCEDLEAAVAWAKRVPIARFGTVEVRPAHDCG
jgi:hypothetical protein